MATEHDSKPDRIRLADCCLVGAFVLIGAILLCGLMTVITHAFVGSPTAAARTIPTQKIDTVRGALHVPGRAYIDGRDEAGVLQTEIDVWKNATREQVVCKLPHRASVFVSAAKWLESEGYYDFRVRNGICEGWVSEHYVSPTLHRSAG